ncbi:MAG: hypothetical protein ABIJ27_07515 [Candidatus Omnitrophota bacterium]
MKCGIHTGRETLAACALCGKGACDECRVVIKGNNYCKTCVAEAIANKSTAVRSPGLAAVLSFFIGGMGQIYNGQILKGILIFCTSLLIIPWIYGIFDAYAVAKKINEGKIKVSAGGCSAAAIFIVMIFIATSMVGCLAAIAIPSFIQARGVVIKNACDANIKQINAATKTWAADTGAGENRVPRWSDLVPGYLTIRPRCSGGGEYMLGTAGSTARCTIEEEHKTQRRYIRSDDAGGTR